MPLPVLSALIRRGKEGDEGAMERIYEQFKRPLFNLAYRYTPDHASAEDLLQDIFVKVFAHLEEVNRDETFVAWMYRIAINTAKNQLVALERRPPGSDVDPDEAEQLDIGVRLKDNTTPEHHLLEDEIARTIRDALAALPEDLRTAITLRELEGLSYEEIAKAMDCPIGTVRSRIFRAREAIDGRLKPLLED